MVFWSVKNNNKIQSFSAIMQFYTHKEINLVDKNVKD